MNGGGFPPGFIMPPGMMTPESQLQMQPQQPQMQQPVYAQEAPAAAPPVDPQGMPPLSMLRVCFSGSLACSGCNPCDTCLAIVRERILPKAMVGGRFNGDAAQAESFLTAYTQSWAQLRLQIQQSIALQQLPALDIRMLQHGMRLVAEQIQTEQLRMETAAAAQAAQAAAAPGVPTSSVSFTPPTAPAPNPAEPTEVMGAPEAANVGGASVSETTTGLINGVTPLTVEDVLAIAAPVPQMHEGGGPQALGSIFDVSPQEVAAHVNGTSTHGHGG